MSLNTGGNLHKDNVSVFKKLLTTPTCHTHFEIDSGNVHSFFLFLFTKEKTKHFKNHSRQHLTPPTYLSGTLPRPPDTPTSSVFLLSNGLIILLREDSRLPPFFGLLLLGCCDTPPRLDIACFCCCLISSCCFNNALSCCCCWGVMVLLPAKLTGCLAAAVARCCFCFRISCN